MNSYTVLLIDDEPDIIEFIGYNLKKEGYIVHSAKDGIEGLKKAVALKPNLILLDVMMPNMDGIETCENIRATAEISNTVISFLTARSEDYSKLSGLEAGADDYISKPIKPKLLVSKVKSLLRRVQKNTDEPLKKQKFRIDKEQYRIYIDDSPIKLPKKEFEILALLTSIPGKVFYRNDIFEKIWGQNLFISDRTIDVHIRKLRAKIGKEYLETVKGVGYKFVNDFKTV